MEVVIVLVFVLGYLAITLEHNLKIDKLVPALLMMAIAWILLAFGIDGFETWFDSHHSALLDGQKLHDGTVMPDFSALGHEARLETLHGTLLHHFGKTSEILFFLVGAMTIVEIIDHFDGFETIKSFVKTNSKKSLLWIVCILGFILSAIIDNLTATIVLITVLRKLVPDAKLRMWYAGLIIVAANAGGAWSPIGDVTTTMLWMNGKVSATGLMEYLIVPSVICMVLPTFIATVLPVFKGDFEPGEAEGKVNPRGPMMMYLGLFLIVLVPVIKTFTHLPPYVGMMFSLGFFSLVAEIVSNRQFSLSNPNGMPDTHGGHANSPTFKALSRIEMPSILFFLGILMTVAALESLGLIYNFGTAVNESMNTNLFVSLLGAGSAVVDNVPLVAASMGMFQLEMDHEIWHFIAYAAGTGGSMLIIGSAAGVVAMGMEKISFFWYLKNIAWLALIGYLAGAGVFLAFFS
ncbi:sodium:proton antiporter NhaD [Parvicella tangerina]|uniref:Na(+)/H(+) antiporter NhaD n=1 Tax=Parvicella tangerina TaxID=2829795 RepID=A0A916JLP0_9FLAO|nr:sodium:proton antiporter NhaD [Parvicella tangerina]CAG5080442.1 Na(+)/H(+) antiporter NhaD [Parvicella tangerina]